MSKKATAKTIPREILDLVRQEFNSSEFIAMSRGTGKWSFIPHLQKALLKFTESEKTKHPDLVIQCPKGTTEDLLRRAFNLKSPPGATKSLRDLLGLYATRGKYDWNELITHDFPDKFGSLLDLEKQEDYATAATPGRGPGMDIFATKIAELLSEKLSPKEIEIVKRQIMDEAPDSLPTKLIENILVFPTNDPERPEFPPKPFYTPAF